MSWEERYHKSRKSLLISSGLLLLGIFIGISQKEDLSGSLLPFKFNNPDYIPHALAVVVIYCLYNTVICWAQLASEIEIPRVRYRDYYIVIFLSSASLLGFLLSLLPDGFSLIGIWEYINGNIKALARILAFISGGMGLLVVVTIIISLYSDRLSLKLSAQKRQLRTKLHVLLESGEWTLVFNPKHSKGEKDIIFLSDGSIGTGKNSNENSWAINKGFLEIYRADGSLQNRFVLERSGTSWQSTNDEEADAVRRGIRDQRIILNADLNESQ